MRVIGLALLACLGVLVCVDEPLTPLGIVALAGLFIALLVGLIAGERGCGQTGPAALKAATNVVALSTLLASMCWSVFVVVAAMSASQLITLVLLGTLMGLTTAVLGAALKHFHIATLLAATAPGIAALVLSAAAYAPWAALLLTLVVVVAIRLSIELDRRFESQLYLELEAQELAQTLSLMNERLASLSQNSDLPTARLLKDADPSTPASVR